MNSSSRRRSPEGEVPLLGWQRAPLHRTPITDRTNWRVESKLREYNNYGMQELTIHEAMPGHYVQLELANMLPTDRR